MLYIKYYPQWPICLGMLFLVSTLSVVMRSWYYLPLPIIVAFVLRAYWRYIASFCCDGEVCPGQVISGSPLRIAVFTDLSVYGDPYPVIKVITPPAIKQLNTFLEPGKRLPLLSLYEGEDDEGRCWRDFVPKFIQCFTSDRTLVSDVEKEISAELWEDLENGLTCLSGKIVKNGLYPLIGEDGFCQKSGRDNFPIFFVEKNEKKSLPAKIWSVAVLLTEIISILLLLAAYVGTPIYFRMTHTISPVLPLEKLHPDTGDLPVNIEIPFNLFEKKLHKAQFETVGCFADFSNNAFTIYVMTFMHNSGRVLGVIYASYFPYHTKKKLESVQMEFISLLPGEAVVTTTNSSDSEYFGKLDKFTYYILPGKENPKELFEIHNTLMEINHHDRAVPLPVKDELIRTFSWLHAKKLQEFERGGTLFFDADENVYRPTLLGAFSMVWQELFPGNYFRRKKIEGGSAEILKEIDLYQGVISDEGVGKL
ncbi:MAG: DUF3239 domain-containing protein [Candidatus Electrothrix scaldis]|nr:MAG: DUF3239 domain-containing protein [Candidatus Electrothrix sp. GW3-3]